MIWLSVAKSAGGSLNEGGFADAHEGYVDRRGAQRRCADLTRHVRSASRSPSSEMMPHDAGAVDEALARYFRNDAGCVAGEPTYSSR